MSTPARPLKVAMVVASPFPANHGTPGSIHEMAEAIAGLGHEVHLVTYHFGEGVVPAVSSGRAIRHHRTPALFSGDLVIGPTWKKPFLDALLALKLVSVVWRERVDVIHGHNYEGALVGYVAKLATGRPLLYNAINTMEDELPTYGFLRPRRLAQWLARLLDRVTPRLADHVVAISEDLGRFLRERGVPPERLEVIPLGIDAGKLGRPDPRPIRERYNPGGPIVLYTGILARLQRLDYLLQAMQTVVKKRPEARLLAVVNLARDGEIAEFLGEAREAGLADHVSVVRVFSFAEVAPFLAAADVTVVPRPHCPGFPVKLLNYMAAGKAIVVFAGSAKGLEHGKTAYVAADHDVTGMALGILAVLDEPGLARTLGENARQRASEEYAWPALAQRTVRAYERLLEKRA